MTNVYIVTENVAWEGSDVMAAFDSRAGAERYVARWQAANRKQRNRYVEILEMEVESE